MAFPVEEKIGEIAADIFATHPIDALQYSVMRAIRNCVTSCAII